MIFEGEELQEPTGEPYRKDSFIFRGFEHNSPKCSICGQDACALVNGWICSDCYLNPLVASLTARNKFEREHPDIFPPEKTVEELWASQVK
jgi:hypothetical protein